MNKNLFKILCLSLFIVYLSSCDLLTFYSVEYEDDPLWNTSCDKSTIEKLFKSEIIDEIPSGQEERGSVGSFDSMNLVLFHGNDGIFKDAQILSGRNWLSLDKVKLYYMKNAGLAVCYNDKLVAMQEEIPAGALDGISEKYGKGKIIGLQTIYSFEMIFPKVKGKYVSVIKQGHMGSLEAIYISPKFVNFLKKQDPIEKQAYDDFKSQKNAFQRDKFR